MFFHDVIGHKNIKERLVSLVDTDRIPHAILFNGGVGVGKLPLALAMARYICCENHENGDSCGRCRSCIQFNKLIHPDVHFVFPITKTSSSSIVCDDRIELFREKILENPYLELDAWNDMVSDGKKTSVIYEQESAEILRKLSFKPYQGSKKVMIIWGVDRMNAESSNKILKILEEPTPDTVFLLITNNEDRILKTVLSRCQRLAVPIIDAENMRQALNEKYSVQKEEEEFLIHNAMGSWSKLVTLLKGNEENKHYFEMFVRMMRNSWSIDIKAIRQWADEISALNRDAQRRFLQYAQRQIRENFILRINLPQLSYMNNEERAFAVRFSQFIHESNVVYIMDELALAEGHILSNCNSKIVFFHLQIKLYTLLKKARRQVP